MSGDLENTIPERIGPYRVVRPIRQGASSAIFAARHELRDERVALRVLIPQQRHHRQKVRQFKKSAVLLARLDHPNLVRVFSAGRAGPYYYTAMELIDSPNLNVLIGERAPDLSRQVYAILVGIARGLSYLHRQGWLQLDLKPENVLLAPGGVPKIIDLDLARPVQPRFYQRRVRRVSGTPAYIAPEFWCRHQVDERTDVFAFGVTGFEILTSRKPWGSDLRELARIYEHPGVPPPRARQLNPEVPAALDEIIARAMALDPAERYPNMHLVTRDLEAVAATAREPQEDPTLTDTVVLSA